MCTADVCLPPGRLCCCCFCFTGGENGLNQAIELSAETLANVKFVQEKRLISRWVLVVCGNGHRELLLALVVVVAVPAAAALRLAAHSLLEVMTPEVASSNCLALLPHSTFNPAASSTRSARTLPAPFRCLSECIFLLSCLPCPCSFFDQISQDTGKFVFGVKDTLTCLDMGAVETLIVWENLDMQRYVFTNTTSGGCGRLPILPACQAGPGLLACLPAC
jgi:hypothetical protein